MTAKLRECILVLLEYPKCAEEDPDIWDLEDRGGNKIEGGFSSEHDAEEWADENGYEVIGFFDRNTGRFQQ